MIDYQKVFAAFIEYAASPDQHNYNELWILCWQRMKALCLSRYGSGSDPEDIDDIINNATLRVLAKLTTADDVTIDFISKTFYWSLRDIAGTTFKKKTNRERIIKRYIAEVESAAKIIFHR